MKYAGGKLYGKCGRRYIPLIMTAEEVDQLEEERDKWKEKAIEAEFRLKQAQNLNTDHESDYLAVWKLIKQPDERVVEAARRLVSQHDEMMKALEAAIRRLETIQETNPEIALDADLAAYRAAIAKARGGQA